jgi:hypothetical protein
MTRVSASGVVLLLAVVLMPTLAGCVSFSVTTTGAASVEDLAAENTYIALYMDHMARVHEDMRVFMPSGDNPGPCNKGGNARDCVSADAQVMGTLHSMREALDAASVPPRFAEADRLLKDAIAREIEGLDLRNRALTAGDDNLWARHAPALEEAATAWRAAYAAFPEDHRPPLAP